MSAGWSTDGFRTMSISVSRAAAAEGHELHPGTSRNPGLRVRPLPGGLQVVQVGHPAARRARRSGLPVTKRPARSSARRHA